MPANIDEPVVVATYDPRWPAWYEEDARELRQGLGARVKSIEHFGSTAVVGLAAKPIIDILVGLLEWPLSMNDRDALEALGYEYLGEAGVVGREYLRRRSGARSLLAYSAAKGPHVTALVAAANQSQAG